MARNSVTVGADGFADLIKDMLQEYGEEVNDIIDPALKKTANKVKREIASAAPGKGEYARSWAVKTERSRLATTYIVYSKKPGLPHLLEFEHALRNGKRSNPSPHIAPADANAADILVSEIERALK